jgi:hypothetical protein
VFLTVQPKDFTKTTLALNPGAPHFDHIGRCIALRVSINNQNSLPFAERKIGRKIAEKSRLPDSTFVVEDT